MDGKRMGRYRSPEEIRRLKEMGVRDVGITYIRLAGFGKGPVHVPWDKETETEEDED